MKKKPIAVLRYLLSVYILGILFFTIFRIILYFTNLNLTTGIGDKTYLFIRAILKGIRFDNVVACFIVFLPLIILSLFSLFNKISKPLIIASNIFFILLYTIAFGISVSDIPYFSYFYSHIGISALEWFHFGSTTIGMLAQETSYVWYYLLFLSSIILFSWTVFYFGKKLLRSKVENLYKKDYYLYIPFVILIWIFCSLGMRGSMQPDPLKASFSYFSNNSFFNQLGVNSVFFFLKTYTSQSKQRNNVNDLMTADVALEEVQEELNIEPINNAISPLSRFVGTKSETINANVVIILMESMSANFLDYEYNGKKLMPYLNHLISESYYFENFYSGGVHTNNGIVSTLYGFPPLFDTPSMRMKVVPYTGIPYQLKKHDYQNLFFMTSNPQYDSMNSFLLGNGFDRIYSENDYPKEKIVNNFGVQDDFLFEYGLQRLNEASQKGKPFFATFLTVSNHTPLIVPKQFEDEEEDVAKNMLAFVDHCLKDFMENAKKQDWYDNTIFILLGDHGSVKEMQSFDMPVDYNHIPCIIHSPLFKDVSKRFSQFGGQIDIFPTLMGLLNIPYINNSLGVDLLNKEEARPCMFFVNDNQLGCIDEDYLYVRNLVTSSDYLYDLNSSIPDNIMNQYPEKAKKLKEYGVSMMVTADYLIKNKVTK